MRMQTAGHHLSSRWLGRVFSLDRCRTGVASQPPVYLCPTLGTLPTASAPTRHFSSRPLVSKPKCEPRYECLNQTRTLFTEASFAHQLGVQPILGKRVPPKKARIPKETIPARKTETETDPRSPTKPLPENCVGCGAFSQTTIPGDAGYYSLERKAVKEYLGLAPEPRRRPRDEVNDVVKKALQGLDMDQLAESGVDLKSMLPPADTDPNDQGIEAKTPLCDRCHDLKFNSGAATPIMHPDLDTLMDTIEASPYKHNHIYHVLDAADFPMSLLPKIKSVLEMMPLRSQNRRSQGAKFSRGRKMDISFIITRSDLLGQSKDKVDALMPYLREVLRDALGRLGRNVRLGNVRCVSAKRNWWTKELRSEIYERGGAGWMVGKVNVGKSSLFAEVFPKGHSSSPTTPPKHDITIPLAPPTESPNQLMPDSQRSPEEQALLPPTRLETNYPAMPVHSPVPGTTAAPIRIPFGNGRGELIDLPGISRSDLASHVRDDKRPTLNMDHRVWPEQQELPFGRSLLLGGLIRITPTTPGLQILAYNFTPLEPHAAATDKCVAVQTQAPDAPHVGNIALPGTGSAIKSAGIVPLAWDVTAHRAGSVIRAMRMRKDGTRALSQTQVLERLPFRVLGVDVLVEGCGWVELVVQVRKRQYPHDYEGSVRKPLPPKEVVEKKETETTTWSKNGLLQTLDLSDPDAPPEPAAEEAELASSSSSRVDEIEGAGEGEGAEKKNEVEWTEADWPAVEVFTPEGRFIGSRRPMNAWVLNKPPVGKVVKRQRKSMKGDDKRRKMDRRRGEGSRQ